MSKRHKIFSHLYIRTIGYIICSVLVVTIPFIIMLSSYSKDKVVQQSNETTHLINGILDDFFQSLITAQNVVATDPDLIIPLTLYYSLPDYDYTEVLNAFRSTHKTIINMTLSQQGLEYVLIGKDGHLPINSTNETINNSFIPKEAEWYQTVVSDTDKSHIFFNNNRNYYSSASKSISVIRAITDVKTGEPIAFIIIDIPYSTFSDVITKVNPEIPIEIYDPKDRSLYTNLEGIQEHSSRDMLGYHTSQFTGITVTNYVRSPFFVQQIGRIVIITLLTMILYLFIIFIISMVSIKRFTKPIYTLIKNMKLVNKGDLDILAKYEGDIIELHDLFNSFNKLKIDLKHMIKVNYETNLLKTQAELNALYQKTDPHFLYNVLETISSQAIIDGSESASIMCQKLGAMFSYNLQDQDLVSFNSEIAHAKDYLFITQKSVSFHDISVEYHLQPDTLELLLPKMTIQPIIENCFKHGFGSQPVRAPHIEISSAIDHQFVTIRIKDNGRGMSPKHLKQLNKRLNAMVEESNFVSNEGVGLRQVHARLNLFYGTKYSIEILSTQNYGTTVILTIPSHIPKE